MIVSVVLIAGIDLPLEIKVEACENGNILVAAVDRLTLATILTGEPV